jgi:hypothetical protein
VHGHEAGAGGGRDLGQRGRDVVHERGTRLHGSLGHLGLAGVDRDPDAGRDEALDHGQDALQLLGKRDGFGTRAGRLAAHVHDVGSLRRQLDPVGDGSGTVQVPPAV